MFTITEAEAALIRAAFEEGNVLVATDELRRLFPAFADRADVQSFTTAIAGWQPAGTPMPKADRPKRKRPG